MFIFYVFDHKYLFWANLVQKLKVNVQIEIWYKDQFEYAKFNGGAYFVCFTLKIAIPYGKFGLKKLQLSV